MATIAALGEPGQMRKQMVFTIPYLNKKVAWNNGDRTYIIGYNGSGKTLLMGEMMTWCDYNNYGYIHYDAVTALSEAQDLINNSSDKDVIHACKMMASLSIDFADDIRGWAKHKNGDSFDQIGDYMKDADLLRDVLRMCGNGYTRMFVMTVKAFANPTADYYFLDMPESSMHLHLAERLVAYIMHNFEYMKVVITTHSPEIVKDVWNDDGSRNYHDIIELPTGYIEAENNRKFNERF